MTSIYRLLLCHLCFCLLCGSFLLFCAPLLRADRHFTFPYESYAEAPGVIESENQVFGRLRRVAGRQTFGIDVRNEIEFGVAKDFELGVYVANWTYRDGRLDDSRGFHYEGVALEPKYRIWDEHAGKPLGIAVLGEIGGGRRFFGLEGRLIVDKRVGKWQAAYNFVVESEWSDFRLRSRTIVLGQSAGVRYDLTPSFSAGAELRYEAAFPNQHEPVEHTLFLGPVFCWDRERFYLTASPSFQVTGVKNEPRFFPRVIAGLKF